MCNKIAVLIYILVSFTLLFAQDDIANDNRYPVTTQNSNVPSSETFTMEEYERFQSDEFRKALSFFFQEKYEMAQHLLEEEIRKNPENHIASAFLGDIYITKGKYQEAISIYRRALDLDPQNAENYFRLGQAYYYQGSGDLAIDHFKKAYQLNPNIKYAQFHIGLTYLKVLRDKHKTIEHWEKYVALAPEDPQKPRITRAIELLRNPNFQIPPPGSDISIEEALHLGGVVLQKIERSDDRDVSADHEDKKTIETNADIERDDSLD